MSDFDLIDALDCSPEIRHPPSRTEQNVEREVKLSEDLNLMVTCNTITMKSVANLVLAMNKLSKSLSLCSRDLSDEELCGAIMDCVVEETIFQEGWSNSSGTRKSVFQRCRSVHKFTVSDEYQKDFILKTGEMKLQAITLQGGNGDRKVNFEMCHYRPPSSSSIGSLTVLLSVSENLHISCSMENGKVSLKLERYSHESLTEINQEDGLDRFLFIKNIPPGGSLVSFESVKFRGWFISTSSSSVDHTVEMCQAATASRVTYFVFQKCN
ncbi:interleukin-1 beta isoform X1 [Poecilia latipinna]|uniref:interleukin-1 beta isoform X1 n=1 Tax=Poecilia latipinna TaxID=48699 RepID=UPI00072E4EBF|nr:PREDICTED: interleukin-1 beta-like isoform X1 [Poecilia latipinna]